MSNIRTQCDIDTKPFACEFCDKAMTEEDHNFCDICDECREEGSHSLDNVWDECREEDYE